jgi:hypothetical protein
MADRKNSVRFNPKILGEPAVLGDAIRSQIQTEQEVAAHAVKAFSARFIAVSDDPLP